MQHEGRIRRQRAISQLVQEAEALQTRTKEFIGRATMAGVELPGVGYETNAELLRLPDVLRDMARSALMGSRSTRRPSMASDSPRVRGLMTVEDDHLVRAVRGMAPQEFARRFRDGLPASALVRVVAALPAERLDELTTRVLVRDRRRRPVHQACRSAQPNGRWR